MPVEGGMSARPHPGPLPRGEGESSAVAAQDAQSGLLRSREQSVATLKQLLPLPGGEGWGEGELSSNFPPHLEPASIWYNSVADAEPGPVTRGRWFLESSACLDAIVSSKSEVLLFRSKS